jgi:DNA-binding transcriptional LysR family regulator
VRVEGQLVLNSARLILEAALSGNGVAYVPESLAQPHIGRGRLKRVLKDWCAPFPGYHLYYPTRRQSSPVFSLMLKALRYEG